MVRVSIITSWVVNFTPRRYLPPVIYTRPRGFNFTRHKYTVKVVVVVALVNEAADIVHVSCKRIELQIYSKHRTRHVKSADASTEPNQA